MSINSLLVPNDFQIQAEGGDVLTADNTVTVTNKNLVDQSNFTVASSLWAGSGTNEVSIRNAPVPEAGQALTATGGASATWQYAQPENGLAGGFTSVFGGAGPQVIETIDLGDRSGGFMVEMDVVMTSNTGESAVTWKIQKAFKRAYAAGGNPVGDVIEVPSKLPAPQGPVIQVSGDAPVDGEPLPTLTAVAPNLIVLTKTGVPLNNTIWGGSWRVMETSVFVSP